MAEAVQHLPALQVQSPEFKPQSQQKKKKRKLKQVLRTWNGCKMLQREDTMRST
jgi:hypothetical protein